MAAIDVAEKGGDITYSLALLQQGPRMTHSEPLHVIRWRLAGGTPEGSEKLGSAQARDPDQFIHTNIAHRIGLHMLQDPSKLPAGQAATYQAPPVSGRIRFDVSVECRFRTVMDSAVSRLSQ